MATRKEFEAARANLVKIRTYFSSHRTWRVPPEAAEAVTGLQRHAHAIADHLRDAAAPEGAGPPEEDALPAHAFDPARLERFARYLEQLSRWFAVVDRTAAGDLLGPLAGEASALAATIEGIVERNGLGSRTEERTARSRPDGPAAEPPAAVPVPDVAPLVLDPAAGEPLLVDVGDGKHELAPPVRARLDGFLEAAALPMSAGDRRRFERDVCRWIEAIPPGQRLIIALSGLTGVVRPYPRYRPAESGD